MRKIQYAFVFAIGLLWLTTAATWAWPVGAPAKLIISGPDIKGEVIVTERALLDGLGPEQFVRFEQRITPASLGDGFKLTRYTPMEGETALFVDHLTYFPHPPGGRGIVRYDGSDLGGGEAFKGGYFYAATHGSETMRRLIQKLGGSLTVSQPNAPDSVSVQLDAVPSPIVAAQPFKLGFTVRAVQQPLADTLIVYIAEAGSASSTVFSARADDAPGHYGVTIQLPRAGAWYWSVDLGVFEGRQEMMPLTVVSNANTTANNPAPPAKDATNDVPYMLTLIAVGGVLLGGVAAHTLVNAEQTCQVFKT